MRALEKLNYVNSFARLPPVFYSRVEPTPLEKPYLVSFNADAAALIDLDPAEARRDTFVAAMAGNIVPPGADPLATLYAGHQFGVYVPQLGDGRAILLGEVMNSRNERWELQLKGAGQTPYSRFADGRAVLRSTIREYLCSEAMHGLGIPTTRALAIVGAEHPVFRETQETAAVLLRLAPTHLRFGSFEVFYYRRQHDHLRILADYVISTHYPQFDGLPDKYHRFLCEVAERTARLIAQWQAVGFSHGVMNTDNMSVLGLTLDYGPYGFMDAFQHGHICNHSDENGRYAYGNQPAIGLWNVACLAQALTPLLPVEQCEAAVARYEPAYVGEYAARMRAKLGLATEQDEDRGLIVDLIGLLDAARADYTIFFRRLADFDTAPGAVNAPLRDLFADRDAFDAWAARYGRRLAAEGELAAGRAQRMKRTNPLYVLRNHLAQAAIERALARDHSEVDRLLDLLKHPFDEQPGMEAYAGFPPDWAGDIHVSCSS